MSFYEFWGLFVVVGVLGVSVVSVLSVVSEGVDFLLDTPAEMAGNSSLELASWLEMKRPTVRSFS